MLMKKLIFGAVIVSAFSVTGSAFAAGGVNLGFFLGVNAGNSKINPNRYYDASTGETADFFSTKSTKNPAFAFGVDAGYMFNKYIGLQFSLNKYQQVLALFNKQGLSKFEYESHEKHVTNNLTSIANRPA